MSVTKRRRMVESIDRKMQQLNVLGLLEVEILVAMTDDIDFQINNFQALNKKIRLKRQNFPAFFA
jgi:hypothetical protein